MFSRKKEVARINPAHEFAVYWKNSNYSPGELAVKAIILLQEGSYIMGSSRLSSELFAYGKSLASIQDVQEFNDSGVSLIHCRAKLEYGETYDNGHDIQANTLLYGNLTSFRNITQCVLRGMVHGTDYQIATIEEAKQIVKLSGGDVWDSSQEEIESLMIQQIVHQLTERDEIIAFGATLRTYKGLMLLSLALGQVPAETFEKAIEHRKRDLAEEERQRQELQQSAMVSAI